MLYRFYYKNLLVSYKLELDYLGCTQQICLGNIKIPQRPHLQKTTLTSQYAIYNHLNHWFIIIYLNDPILFSDILLT